MTWKAYFTSSVGRKIVMAFTGLFLILFLIVHAGVNACIFLNDGGVTFNAAAHFMSHNYIVRFLEIGLFVFFILHIVQGITLTLANNAKRPVKYAVNPGNATSKWYSRSMGILGSLLLIFLVMHLSHFWVGTKASVYITHKPHDTFAEMKEVFASPMVLVAYLVGVISLFWHLIHGFASAFQTIGVNSSKYNGMIRNAGYVYSVIICLAFALMPISIYMDWLQ